MRATTVVAAALAAVTATTAFAATSKPTIKAAHNSSLGKTVVVDGRRGMTLYHLSPETKSHLLCRTAQCEGFWPPLTVKSLHTKLRKGTGISGKLGIFKRPDGKFQVTLRGIPLYRFSGDSAKGQANGNGIKSFGGTWHAVTAKAATSAPAPAAAPAPAPAPTTTNPYPY
jgi:predicted lipoprotein with Yx(FWY)xxD motif